MKALLCLLLVSAPTLAADESTDRAAIEQAIATINQLPRDLDFPGLASLPNVVQRARILELRDRSTPTLTISHEPWGEATINFLAASHPKLDVLNPRISGGIVTFITPEIALSDGLWTYNTGTSPQTIPLLFIMKKEGADWRIVSLRTLAPR